MVIPLGKFHHGLAFEKKARIYLENKGYRLIAQNVRYRCGEIDLVAEKDETLVFVEVRKRAVSPWIEPHETLTQTKVIRLKRAIQCYLQRYRGRAKQVRIDLIGFSTSLEREQITHFENFVVD